MPYLGACIIGRNAASALAYELALLLGNNGCASSKFSLLTAAIEKKAKGEEKAPPEKERKIIPGWEIKYPLPKSHITLD